MDKTNIQKAVTPEFSRPVKIMDVSQRQPLVKSITAKPEEHKALSKRFDLISMDNLTADVILKQRMGGNMIEVSGEFSADVVQKCIVTLEPVPGTVKGTLEGFFTTIKPATPIQADNEIPTEQEDPEYVSDGVIDIGELVSEFVALELPLYPRKDGVKHTLVDEDISEGSSPQSAQKERTYKPFAILKDMQDKPE